MGYVWKDDKENGRYFWNVTSFKNYAKQKYNKAYETSLGEILAKLCEKEKNKYPDKKMLIKDLFNYIKHIKNIKVDVIQHFKRLRLYQETIQKNIEKFKKK